MHDSDRLPATAGLAVVALVRSCCPTVCGLPLPACLRAFLTKHTVTSMLTCHQLATSQEVTTLKACRLDPRGIQPAKQLFLQMQALWTCAMRWRAALAWSCRRRRCTTTPRPRRWRHRLQSWWQPSSRGSQVHTVDVWPFGPSSAAPKLTTPPSAVQPE